MCFLAAKLISVISTENSVGRGGSRNDDADTLLSYLRDIANAPSPTSTDLPVDYNYKKVH